MIFTRSLRVLHELWFHAKNDTIIAPKFINFKLFYLLYWECHDKNPYQILFLFRIIDEQSIKGTVCVISIDPLLIDVNARFTTVPLKAMSDKE